MSFELRVPSVGESIAEVQIGEWRHQQGQSVRKDEVLALIESEKATIELPSPADGVLSEILKKPGETARVGEVIGRVEARDAEAASPEPSGTAPLPAVEGRPAIMPAARRVLADAGIPAANVPGTGRAGRVTKEDALRAAASAKAAGSEPTPIETSPGAPSSPPPAASPHDDGDRDEVVAPMSPLRRTVARRLVEAQSTMAMLTTFNEIDMSAVTALRKQYQEVFQTRHGVKLGLMSFFLKAAIEALKETPALNAEIRDNQIVYHQYYDIGVAIGGGKGLVVPVIRSAERLSFAGIEKTIADLAARAKEGRIKPEELHGGTFTVTNGGMYGSLLSTPIINPPQSGILGMHAIQERPVVVAGQIVARPMMYVALTYDHRIVDGREGVACLKRIKEIIEAPARMLIEA